MTTAVRSSFGAPGGASGASRASAASTNIPSAPPPSHCQPQQSDASAINIANSNNPEDGFAPAPSSAQHTVTANSDPAPSAQPAVPKEKKGLWERVTSFFGIGSDPNRPVYGPNNIPQPPKAPHSDESDPSVWNTYTDQYEEYIDNYKEALKNCKTFEEFDKVGHPAESAGGQKGYSRRDRLWRHALADLVQTGESLFGKKPVGFSLGGKAVITSKTNLLSAKISLGVDGKVETTVAVDAKIKNNGITVEVGENGVKKVQLSLLGHATSVSANGDAGVETPIFSGKSGKVSSFANGNIHSGKLEGGIKGKVPLGNKELSLEGKFNLQVMDSESGKRIIDGFYSPSSRAKRIEERKSPQSSTPGS